MKKKFLAGCIIGLLLFGLTGMAGATVIDFQSLEVVGNVNAAAGPTYSEDGFTLNNLTIFPHFYRFGTLDSRYLGSTALFNNAINGITELVETNGSSFNLYSIDLGELLGSNSASVTFNGNQFGGGFVTQTFTLDTFFATNNLASFQTFNFSGFTNLMNVTWAQTADFHQFDNIVLDPVPEPATMLLLGTGLVGVAGAARRRKKNKA